MSFQRLIITSIYHKSSFMLSTNKIQNYIRIKCNVYTTNSVQIKNYDGTRSSWTPLLNILIEERTGGLEYEMAIVYVQKH